MSEFDQDDYEDDYEDDQEEPRRRSKSYDQRDYRAKTPPPIKVTAPDGREFRFETMPVSSRVMTKLRQKEASVDDVMAAVLTEDGLDEWDDWVDEYDPPMSLINDIANDLFKAASGKSRRRRRSR